MAKLGGQANSIWILTVECFVGLDEPKHSEHGCLFCVCTLLQHTDDAPSVGPKEQRKEFNMAETIYAILFGACIGMLLAKRTTNSHWIGKARTGIRMLCRGRFYYVVYEEKYDELYSHSMTYLRNKGSCKGG